MTPPNLLSLLPRPDGFEILARSSGDTILTAEIAGWGTIDTPHVSCELVGLRNPRFSHEARLDLSAGVGLATLLSDAVTPNYRTVVLLHHHGLDLSLPEPQGYLALGLWSSAEASKTQHIEVIAASAAFLRRCQEMSS